MSEESEINEILEGIVIERFCKHHCTCGCHRGRYPGIHVGTCCTPCTRGHDTIRHGTLDTHLKECHALETHTP